MKSVSRQSLRHWDIPMTSSHMDDQIYKTAHRIKYRGKYIHCLRRLQDFICNTEIFMNVETSGYQITWKTTKSTHIRFYTLVSGSLEYLVDISDNFARFVGTSGTFSSNTKIIGVATTDPVNVIMSWSPRSYKSYIDSPYYTLNSRLQGHQEYSVYNDYKQLSNDIKEYSSRHAVPRVLNTYTEAPAPIEFAADLIYYLHLDSIITISTNIQTAYRCQPFSVKLEYGSNLTAVIDYQIQLSPCAETAAKITVTAIETVTADSYVNVLDTFGKSLISHHTGCLISGQFSLPVGLTDVGLHIYTPYGYGDDTSKNKYTDLAIFKSYRITYVLK